VTAIASGVDAFRRARKRCATRPRIAAVAAKELVGAMIELIAGGGGGVPGRAVIAIGTRQRVELRARVGALKGTAGCHRPAAQEGSAVGAPIDLVGRAAARRAEAGGFRERLAGSAARGPLLGRRVVHLVERTRRTPAVDVADGGAAMTAVRIPDEL